MILTASKLKKILNYNMFTGYLTWKQSMRNGSVKKGSIAGSIDHGYIRINIKGKKYSAHRLAWLYMTGKFPTKGIDHKDRIKHHNWWSNLRLLSNSNNQKNTGNWTNNTSGIKGVCWHKLSNKWEARIRIGKTKFLGLYKNFDDAVCARLAGEQCLEWDKYNKTSPAYQYVQKMLKENYDY